MYKYVYYLHKLTIIAGIIMVKVGITTKTVPKCAEFSFDPKFAEKF